MSTLPNPLSINFGTGRIIIGKWKDKNGRGLMFRDSGSDHPVGADCNLPHEPSHEPQEGEIYLHFANIESAKVLQEMLGEVIAEWPDKTTPQP